MEQELSMAAKNKQRKDKNTINQPASTKIQCLKRIQRNTHVCRIAETTSEIQSHHQCIHHHHQITFVIQEGGCFESFVFLRRRRGLWSPLLSSSSSLSSSSTINTAVISNRNYFRFFLLFHNSPTPLTGNDHLHSINATESNSHNQTIQCHSQFAIIIATTH